MVKVFSVNQLARFGVERKVFTQQHKNSNNKITDLFGIEKISELSNLTSL